MKKAKRKFPGVSFGQQNVRMMAMSSEGRGDVLYDAPAPPEMAELQVATTEVSSAQSYSNLTDTVTVIDNNEDLYLRYY